MHTSVKSNTRHPVWDETYTLLVHDTAHQSLKLSLWDSDTITADDEIGRYGLLHCFGLLRQLELRVGSDVLC